MRRAMRVGMAALVVALSVLVGVSPAHAATNLVQNPGMEALGSDGFPTCWEKSGYGDNDYAFALTSQAHSGANAMQISITRINSGDRKAMMFEATSCAPNVTAGHQYDLSLWYTTSTPNTVITAFRHDTSAGWQYWMDLNQLPVTSTFTQTTVRTPAVPANTDQITWGVTIYGVGTLVTDDYSMTDPTTAPTQPNPDP